MKIKKNIDIDVNELLNNFFNYFKKKYIDKYWTKGLYDYYIALGKAHNGISHKLIYKNILINDFYIQKFFNDINKVFNVGLINDIIWSLIYSFIHRIEFKYTFTLNMDIRMDNINKIINFFDNYYI